MNQLAKENYPGKGRKFKVKNLSNGNFYFGVKLRKN
jgi:hypothetical protein